MKKYLKYLLMMAAIVLCVGGMEAEAKSLRLSAPAKEMYVKQKMQMKVTPSSMKNKVKWKSSNSKIASVSKNGTVTAKKAGKVKIYAVSSKNNNKKAVYQLTVRNFKAKTLSSNCWVIRDGSSLIPSIGKKYKVFQSQEEVSGFLKEDKKNGGYVSYYLEKKLKSYKKSFFKKNCLCVIYITTVGSGSTPVSVESIQLVQSGNGKVTAKLRAGIGVQGPDENWTADVATFYAVAELDKKDAQMIQGYAVEEFMMTKLPTIYD